MALLCHCTTCTFLHACMHRTNQIVPTASRIFPQLLHAYIAIKLPNLLSQTQLTVRAGYRLLHLISYSFLHNSY